MTTTLLKSGTHATREDGMCAMEFAAYLAGEPHTDHPKCVDKSLCKKIIEINDSLADDHARTSILMPLVEASIGTAGKGFNFAIAWKAYNEATAPALKVCDKATAPALKVCDKATTTAWKVYNKARATARKAYEEATATARKAYEEATATVARSFVAACLAIINSK